MKVRSGFVSNSSSSSFIVACDSDAKTTVTVSFEVDLQSYARRSIATIEELNEYFDYKYGDDKWWKYEDCRKAIEAGKTVLVGWFTDETQNLIEVFLCDNGLKGLVPEDSGIAIIQSDGGY